MVDFLYSIDLNLFYFINHTISNPILDKFFPFITDVKNWYLAYLILLGITFFKGGRLGKFAFFGIILVIATSDQLSSNLLKHWIGRIRPCNELPNVNILVSCTGSFSFPSSHAVNNFAAAVFFGKLFPKLRTTLLISASIIALSRPYVGVHYPSDIVAGALIGSLVGYVFALIIKMFYDLTLKNKPSKMDTDTRIEKVIKAERYEK